MTDLHWKQVLELYEGVCELSGNEAEARLNRSGVDPEIVSQVSILLNHLEPDESGPRRADPPQQFAGCSIGRYEVIERIGRGSTGEVYSGRDKELDRPVALKFVTADFAGEGIAARRFLREAQAAAALNHPGIVTVYEVISWNALPVIVTELVEGNPLRALCGNPMPVHVAIRISTQLMQALAFVHASGIVHRDVKPENIIVRRDGYIKLLDLGLARRTLMQAGSEELSSTAGFPVGTLRYMSPEQCRGESATAASDVFSAGLIFYEMLSGRHPFHADSALDTAHAIAWSKQSPIPHVAPWVNGIIDRMLAKDLQERPSASDIAAVLLEEPASVPPRPRYQLPAFAVAAALLLLTGAGLAWLLGQGGSVSRKQDRSLISESANLDIVPVASFLGSERHPSFSPDGSSIAFSFSGEREPISHIYIRNLSAPGATLITTGPSSDFEPVFSPDGTRLAFLRELPGRRLRVMIMPAAGGVELLVGEVWRVSVQSQVITWNPDGKRLIVSDRIPNREASVGLIEIDVETSARRQVTSPEEGKYDLMPSFSPDGRVLGFARLTSLLTGVGAADIWTIPIAGEIREQPLTKTGQRFSCWAWTPDGKELLVAYLRSGRYLLARRQLSNGALRWVAGVNDQVRDLAVARTGGRIVYGPGEDRNYKLWKYSLPPSKDPPVHLLASAEREGDVAYSADGKYIAYVAVRAGRYDIWICASDGSKPHPITSLEKSDLFFGSPAWSPDGRWIAFDGRSRDSGRKIFVVDVLEGKTRLLTALGPNESEPAFSHDSRWIYFSSDRQGSHNIWKISLVGGEPTQVTRNGGYSAFESTDGRFLYFMKNGVRYGLWRMPSGGGNETQVAQLDAVSTGYWFHLQEQIYFVSAAPSPRLIRLNLLTGQTSPIMSMPAPDALTHQALSVSPDGRSVIFLRSEPIISNLTMVSVLS